MNRLKLTSDGNIIEETDADIGKRSGKISILIGALSLVAFLLGKHFFLYSSPRSYRVVLCIPSALTLAGFVFSIISFIKCKRSKTKLILPIIGIILCCITLVLSILLIIYMWKESESYYEY